MNNAKKIAIIVIVVILVLGVAIVFRNSWLEWLNQLIKWVGTQLGVSTDGLTISDQTGAGGGEAAGGD